MLYHMYMPFVYIQQYVVSRRQRGKSTSNSLYIHVIFKMFHALWCCTPLRYPCISAYLSGTPHACYRVSCPCGLFVGHVSRLDLTIFRHAVYNAEQICSSRYFTSSLDHAWFLYMVVDLGHTMSIMQQAIHMQCSSLVTQGLDLIFYFIISFLALYSHPRCNTLDGRATLIPVLNANKVIFVISIFFSCNPER